MSPNSAPCTDFLREQLYIRSCIGVDGPPAAAHLVDETARLEPSDVALEAHRAILSTIYEFADARRRPYSADIEPLLREPALGVFQRIMQGNDTQPPPKLAAELRKLAKRRRAYEHTMKIAAAYVAGDDDRAAELTHELKAEGQEARTSEYMHASETIEHARTELAARKGVGDFRSGYPALDSAIGQFRESTLTVIGGYEGTGKSSLMLGMAMNFATRGIPSGIVSLEDSASVWGPRVASHLSDLNPREFDGARGPVFDANVNSAITLARELGVYFAFEEQQPLNKVLAAIRHLVRKNGCRAIFIDYLQCMRGPVESSKRNEYVAHASARVKAQIQRLQVAGFLGSQLNNPDKGKEFKEPRNTALKESGDIKDMAENIILLWCNSDESDKKTFGKLSKCKWSPARPRFEVVRNPRTGCVEGLSHG